MYDLSNHAIARLQPTLRQAATAVIATLVALATSVAGAQALPLNDSLVREISGTSDKLEITTNTSRILTLGKKIPRVQVNNPDLLAVTPLSATQIQVSAKKAGVTQVNLWDDEGQIHTVDVFIYGDVRELEHALKTQFPNSSVRVYRYSQSLVLTGFIDRPDYVDPIRQLAEDYAPKVINNIAVGGVQQVLLKVKVYEISRTKARQMGTDFAAISQGGGFFASGVSGLIDNVSTGGGITSVIDSGGQTVEFAVTNGTDSLFGFLDWLTERNLAKILAEPNIVAVSGRPALFNEGGEIPILVPQSLGQIAIEYKPFGTQVDFLPIVLGNGKIRLEVRPRISDLDFANAVTINDLQVPALSVRQVDTAVEMNAGQTFAIAGLIQQRIRSVNRGIPLLADIPLLGIPFRRVEDNVEEVELLVLVTPEFVDAMDPHEVPPCGPGMSTVAPTDCELFIGGKIESPDPCSPCGERGCGPQCVAGGFSTAPPSLINSGGQAGMPSMQGYEQMSPMMAPPEAEQVPLPSGPQFDQGASRSQPTSKTRIAAAGDTSAKGSTPFRSQTQPGFVRQATRPYEGAMPAWAGGDALIGPVGYDED
ncbi:type II and III secretion system protein family protein [Botrimarina hoheduenensis]|uniref:Type II secretion system protein D n=1 Tax=Botrimarina hoheduenensis TaxID=2528000 RepID=A0A5C5WD34_9BACT|nr:pilus assembly protein N-terminal domain-containing protein [Botrimarina hoheduenensis]TWT48574.1 Type II secretion system protein D precursor [Botrimarina hoheduenensis]